MKEKLLSLTLLLIFSISFGQNFEEKILRLKKETPKNVTDFQIVDYNNDGLKDIICINGTNSNVKISAYINQGNDTFNHELIIGKDNNNNFQEGFLKVADLNNDGNYDIITNGDHGFSVFRNQGANNFTEQIIDYTSSNSIYYKEAEISDIDGNGYLDIVLKRCVSGYTSETIKYFLNDGNWNFFEQSLASLNVSEYVDFNNDGFMDVIGDYNGSIRLYENNGQGSFTPSTLIPSYDINFNFNRIKVSDINNDGFNDIFLYSFNSNNIKYFSATNTNDFNLSTIYSSNINYLDFIDYDNDGNKDIFISKTTGSGYADNKAFQIIYNLNNNFSNSEIVYRGVLLEDEIDYLYTGNKIIYEDLNNNGEKDIVYWVNDRIGYLDKNGTDLTSRVVSEESFGVVKMGDFDNDGHKDIIFSELTNEHNTSWFKNINNNYFPQIIIEDVDDYNPYNYLEGRLNVGSLNNNNQLDIVSGRKIFIVQNQQILEQYDYLLSTTNNRLIDYDNDGDLDVIGRKTDLDDDIIYLAINSGSGTLFAENALQLNTNIGDDFLMFDFNNDNLLDFVSSLDYQTKIITNNGNNNFSSNTLNYSMGNIAYGDFNNDNFIDIVGDGITIYVNNSGTTFTPSNIFTNITNPAVGDFNNDGNLDIVAFDENLNKTVILINNGNLNFIKEIVESYSFTGGSNTDYNNSLGKFYVVGDIDEDNDLDFILNSSEEIILYKNSLINLSIVENEINNSTYFYPIPSKNKLFISSEKEISSLTVYDLNGKKIEINYTNEYIDISSLSNGIYIVKYIIDGKIFNSKFIKN